MQIYYINFGILESLPRVCWLSPIICTPAVEKQEQPRNTNISWPLARRPKCRICKKNASYDKKNNCYLPGCCRNHTNLACQYGMYNPK